MISDELRARVRQLAAERIRKGQKGTPLSDQECVRLLGDGRRVETHFSYADVKKSGNNNPRGPA